jgi:hypothetical protein
MIKTALFLLLLLAVNPGFAQSYEPVAIDGLYGFSSEEKLVLPAQYQYATHFREGRALVKLQDKWGFIDSTGAWIVRPVFDAAQPFVDGKSYVFLNGKSALIDLNGTYLVEPIYDRFEEQYYGMEVMNGDKKGLISDRWSARIPVEYLEFTAFDDFVSAKTDRNNYDLYYRGNLVIKGLDRPPGQIQVAKSQAIVCVNDQYGVVGADGNWVIEPVYKRIAYLYLGESYPEENDGLYKALYLLDNSEYVYDDPEVDVRGAKELYLARENGVLIGNGPFPDIQVLDNIPGTPGLIEVALSSGKIGYVKRDYSLEETPYSTMQPFYTWKLAYDSERWHILDAYNTGLGVFDDVSIPETSQVIYDEYGEPTGYMTDEEYLPYLTVTKGTGQYKQTAIFSLEDKRLITPWSESARTVVRTFDYAPGRVFLLRDETTQRFAYYHAAMDQCSAFEFTYLELLGRGYLTGVKEQGDVSFLYAVDYRNGVSELLSAPVIGWSEDVAYVEVLLPDESGESDMYYRTAFSRGFVYYRDANGRFGIVAQNNRITPALSDTLIQNETMSDYVNIRANGKWGSIDVRNAHTVAPAYDIPLAFYYESAIDAEFSLIEPDSCYVNAKGKRFYALSSEYMIFKEKGRYGIKTWSDFPRENEERIVLIPAAYKNITLTDYPNLFIAKGTNGKYGIINNFNDTLLPFIHTSIKPSYNDLSIDSPAFETMIGKRKGLFPVYGTAIPARYDSFTAIYDGLGMHGGVLVKSEGKVGLYNLTFDEVLPCEYDAICCVAGNPDQAEVRALKNGKWYVLLGTTYQLTEKQLLRQRAYDLLIDDNGYVKTPGGYDRYDLATGALTGKNLPENELIPENPDAYYRLFVKNGLVGALDGEGKEVLQPSLSMATTWEDGTVITVKDGEFVYYVFSANKYYKSTEW